MQTPAKVEHLPVLKERPPHGPQVSVSVLNIGPRTTLSATTQRGTGQGLLALAVFLHTHKDELFFFSMLEEVMTRARLTPAGGAHALVELLDLCALDAAPLEARPALLSSPCSCGQASRHGDPRACLRGD